MSAARIAIGIGLLAVVFALGIVLGDALGDRPPAANPLTVERSVRVLTVTATVAELTTTVEVEAGAP